MGLVSPSKIRCIYVYMHIYNFYGKRLFLLMVTETEESIMTGKHDSQQQAWRQEQEVRAYIFYHKQKERTGHRIRP